MVALFQAYAAALATDLGFQNFDAELAALPGAYAPPSGRLFLARLEGRAVGCVALRRLDAETAEMKRLYVDPGARGHRVGLTLVEAVCAAAKAAGFARICLDTLPEMNAAQQLYGRLGFRETAPYCFNPVAGARFMALDLRPLA